MVNHNADADEARTVVKQLNEGDVIEIPQYANALEVTHTGELNGEANAFIGVRFADESKRTSADKSMVVNINSGRVYLTAGSTDKGEVTEIRVVSAANPEDEGTEEIPTEEEDAEALPHKSTEELEAEKEALREPLGRDTDEDERTARLRAASRRRDEIRMRETCAKDEQVHGVLRAGHEATVTYTDKDGNEETLEGTVTTANPVSHYTLMGHEIYVEDAEGVGHWIRTHGNAVEVDGHQDGVDTLGGYNEILADTNEEVHVTVHGPASPRDEDEEPEDVDAEDWSEDMEDESTDPLAEAREEDEVTLTYRREDGSHASRHGTLSHVQRVPAQRSTGRFTYHVVVHVSKHASITVTHDGRVTVKDGLRVLEEGDAESLRFEEHTGATDAEVREALAEAGL